MREFLDGQMWYKMRKNGGINRRENRLAVLEGREMRTREEIDVDLPGSYISRRGEKACVRLGLFRWVPLVQERGDGAGFLYMLSRVRSVRQGPGAAL